MKIILQKPVDNLGNPGDVAEVADGYARNYLIPRGLAIKAEKGALRHAESLKRAHVSRLSKEKGAQFDKALAATIVESEPKARRIQLPTATIHNGGETDAWLKQVKQQIEGALEEGPVII